MSEIIAEHLKAAKKVFKTLNSRLTGKLGNDWLPGPGAATINSLFDFFSKNLDDLGSQPFGLRVAMKQDEVKEADKELTSRLIRDEIMESNGAVLFTVDSNLRVLDVQPMPVETEECNWNDMMQEASESAPVFFFEQRNCVRVFGGKGYVDEFVPATGEKAGRINRFSRQSINYRTAIREHYEQCVKNSDDCDHWEVPEKRELRSQLGNRKTEEIFQSSLLSWLKHNLTDGNPWPEPRKPNRDRADIKIEVFGGGFYLIEIKWMGRSNRTRCQLNRTSSGLKQLRQYLQQPPCPKHATLVVYDGRDESEFEKLRHEISPVPGMKIITECENINVPPGGECQIYFLFSKQASKL